MDVLDYMDSWELLGTFPIPGGHHMKYIFKMPRLCQADWLPKKLANVCYKLLVYIDGNNGIF